MRIRTFAAVLTAAAVLAPLGAQAGNREDCDSPIKMRSGQGLIANAEVANCGALRADEITYSPVLPGGAADILFNGSQPANGNRTTGFGSYLEYTSSSLTGAQSTIRTWLTFTQGQGLNGPISAWGSQSLSFSVRDSITAGNIYVRVIEMVQDPFKPEQCLNPGDVTTCYTVHERTFKTLTGWADGV